MIENMQAASKKLIFLNYPGKWAFLLGVINITEIKHKILNNRDMSYSVISDL